MVTFLIGFNLCCAFFHHTQRKDGKIKKEIIKGVTTETVVLNLFGMPFLVATNNIGDEVWNYKNITYSTEKSNDGKKLTLWELTTGDSTEVPKPFHLMITFDQNDIVKHFEIVNISFQDY